MHILNYLSLLGILTCSLSSFAADSSKSEQMINLINQSRKNFEKAIKSRNINNRDEQGKTLLMHTIEQNNVQKVRILIRQKANPWIEDHPHQITYKGKSLDKQSQNTFHKAAMVGNLEILRRLLRAHEFDPQWEKAFPVGSGPTPHMLAQDNKHNGCEILLCNFNRIDNSLFKAIMLGHRKKIDKILDKHPEKIQKYCLDESDEPNTALPKATPLDWACMLEDVQLVEHLLAKSTPEMNCELCSQEPGGISLYTQMGMVSCKACLEKNCHDTSTCQDRNKKEIKLLMEEYGAEKLSIQADLFQAIKDYDTQKIAWCLKKYPDLKEERLHNHTPLEYAIRFNKMRSTKELIRLKADVNTKVHYGASLLAMAFNYDNIEAIKLLTNHGAKFNSLYQDWPFDYPISEEAKKILLETFRQKVVRNQPKPNQMRSAVCSGKSELVESIAGRKEHYQNTDTQGLTPLHWAVTKGDPKLTALLIKNGADINAQTSEKRRTPLRQLIRMHESGVRYEHRQLTTSELLPCLFILMCEGADPTIEDRWGDTAYTWIGREVEFFDGLTLIHHIIRAAKRSSPKERMKLLNEINLFQKKEFEKAQKDGDEEKAEHIKQARVIRFQSLIPRRIPKTISPENFKEIYQPYIPDTFDSDPANIASTSGSSS
ncbi:MAG: ankyrin repeat domain-containing protein [Candidatus Dependentiae bacterium]